MDHPDNVNDDDNGVTEPGPIINLEYLIPLNPGPTLEIKGPEKTTISLEDLKTTVQPILTPTSLEPTTTTTPASNTSTATTAATAETSSELEQDELSFTEDNPAGSLSKEYLIQDRQDSNCYVQTCDQTITGRQLSYQRSLDIVQGEEYLEAADTDIIRRQFIVRPKFSVSQR